MFFKKIPGIVVCFSILCAGAAAQATPDSQIRPNPPSGSPPAPTSQEPVPSPKPQVSSQTTPGTQSPPYAQSTQNPREKTAEEKRLEREEQSHRMLGVIPDFGTTSRHDASPLTSHQKFHLFAKSAFDPVELSVVALQAALSQAEDEFPEYGQGAAGYGKRYGATLADEVSSSFWTNYFYPVLLKEDPRYFRLGEGTVKHRILYALSQEVSCRTDKGGRSFAWENVLGALTTGDCRMRTIRLPSVDWI